MGTYQNNAFLNDWHDGDVGLLKKEFGLPAHELANVTILLATYIHDELGGEAFVLFRKDGMLYEVNASHDSMGLMTGQWEPEETCLKALRYRLEQGRLGRGSEGSNLFADELNFLLTELEMGVPL